MSPHSPTSRAALLRIMRSISHYTYKILLIYLLLSQATLLLWFVCIIMPGQVPLGKWCWNLFPGLPTDKVYITFQWFEILGGKQLLPISILMYKACVTSKCMLLNRTPPWGNRLIFLSVPKSFVSKGDYWTSWIRR